MQDMNLYHHCNFMCLSNGPSKIHWLTEINEICEDFE